MVSGIALLCLQDLVEYLNTEHQAMPVLIRSTEVVGLSPALRAAFDLIRPWGVISSIGVHNGEVRSCSVTVLP